MFHLQLSFIVDFHCRPARPILQDTVPITDSAVFGGYFKKKKKKSYKKLITHVESHASAVNLLKRAENSVI